MNRPWLDLDVLVKDARTMKPLPASTTCLAAIVFEPDWDLHAISEIVRLDQALTGRILGCANSALSGAMHEIKSLDQAVVRLGPGTVLAIAIGSSVQEMFCEALPAYGLSQGDLWRHSVATAFAIEAARPFCRVPVPSEAFAAALLHDVGKLALARYLDAETLAVVRAACTEQGLAEDEIEEELLRLPHPEVGARVAEAWGLPARLTSGIRYHHAPLYAPGEEGRRLCQQIALADAVARAIGAPGGTTSEPAGLDVVSADRLGISGQGFDELCAKVAGELDAVIAAIG